MPVLYPACDRMLPINADVEPLPFVPATWTKRSSFCGSPSIPSSVLMFSRPSFLPNLFAPFIYSSASSYVISITLLDKTPYRTFCCDPCKYHYRFAPQHFLYFLPLPHGHGSFLPTLAPLLTTGLRGPLSPWLAVTGSATFSLLGVPCSRSIRMRSSLFTESYWMLRIISSNISKPSNLYSTTGSRCPYALMPIP